MSNQPRITCKTCGKQHLGECRMSGKGARPTSAKKPVPVCDRCGRSHVDAKGNLTKCKKPKTTGKPNNNKAHGQKSVDAISVPMPPLRASGTHRDGVGARVTVDILLSTIEACDKDDFVAHEVTTVNPMTLAARSQHPGLQAAAGVHKMYTVQKCSVKLVPVVSNTMALGTTCVVGVWEDPTGSGPQNINEARQSGKQGQVGQEIVFSPKCVNDRKYNVIATQDQKENTPFLIFVAVYGKTTHAFTGNPFTGLLYHMYLSIDYQFYTVASNKNFAAESKSVQKTAVTIKGTADGVELIAKANLMTCGRHQKGTTVRRAGQEGVDGLGRAIFRIVGFALDIGQSVLPPPWSTLLYAGSFFLRAFGATGEPTDRAKAYSSYENAQENDEPSKEWQVTGVIEGELEQLTDFDVVDRAVSDGNTGYRARKTAPKPEVQERLFISLFCPGSINEGIVMPFFSGSKGESVDEISVWVPFGADRNRGVTTKIIKQTLSVENGARSITKFPMQDFNLDKFSADISDNNYNSVFPRMMLSMRELFELVGIGNKQFSATGGYWNCRVAKGDVEDPLNNGFNGLILSHGADFEVTTYGARGPTWWETSKTVDGMLPELVILVSENSNTNYIYYVRFEQAYMEGAGVTSIPPRLEARQFRWVVAAATDPFSPDSGPPSSGEEDDDEEDVAPAGDNRELEHVFDRHRRGVVSSDEE